MGGFRRPQEYDDRAPGWRVANPPAVLAGPLQASTLEQALREQARLVDGVDDVAGRHLAQRV